MKASELGKAGGERGRSVHCVLAVYVYVVDSVTLDPSVNALHVCPIFHFQCGDHLRVRERERERGERLL